MNNILVVYFSYSGNTEKLANIIAKKTSGMLRKIELVEEYTSDYSELVRQAKSELESGRLPELKEDIKKLPDYDTILIGSPIWWGFATPPVVSFIKQHSFVGKNVGLFCTHGGGGLMKVKQSFTKSCKGMHFLGAFDVYGKGDAYTESEISEWLSEIGAI